LSDCNSELTEDFFITNSNTIFEIDTDPIQEINRNVCVECLNKKKAVQSETFNVKVVCPNDIKVFEPEGTSWIS
jgi:hypothetical protein